MSVYHIEGWEGWSFNGFPSGSPYVVSSGGGANTQGSARTGNVCLNWGGNGGYWFARLAPAAISGGQNRADSTVGCAMKMVSSAGSGRLIGFIYSTFSGSWSDTIQTEVRITNTGQFQAYRNGTLLASSSSSGYFGDNNWHYIELYTKISASVGELTFRYDGANVAGLVLTGINTDASGSGNLNGFLIGSPNQSLIDDIYALDSSGSTNNTFLGDQKVYRAVATADASPNAMSIGNLVTLSRSTAYTIGQFVIDPNGNTQRCTTAGTTASSAPSYNTSGTTTDGSAVFTFWGTGSSHYLMIKEAGTGSAGGVPDDATSYVQSAVVGDTELYTPSTLTGLPAGVSVASAVSIDMRAEKDQTTARSIRAVLKSGSTTVDSGVDLALQNGTWASMQQAWQTDPNTSAQIQLSNISGMRFGGKVSV